MKISPVKNSKFIYVSQNFQYHFSTMLKLEKFSKRVYDLTLKREQFKQTEKSGFYIRDFYGNEYENAFEIPLKVGFIYENNKKAKS